MSVVVSKIDQAGRISITAQQRRALGLESGSPIVINVVESELRIRSMHTAMTELQAESERFVHNEATSVDAFIAQRRTDVDGEEEVAASSNEAERRGTPGTDQ